MIKILKYFILGAVIILGLLVFSYRSNINSPADAKGAETVFVISKGEGVKKIGKNLAEKKLIKSELFFQFYVWLENLSGDFEAGKYNLSAKMAPKEIIRMLTAGEAVSEEKEITIIPGWTSRDIAAYFAKEGISSEKEFYQLAGESLKDYNADKKAVKPKDYSGEYDFLKDKPKNYGLEGYLFPDTYRIYKNASADEAVNKMLANFGAKLSPALRAEIVAQGKTIYQIVTMASVIEKEVRSNKDMKIVSGIFWGRMKIGQPLQSCATLAYILGENKAIYSLADTQINSPYNTYRHQGLPPGPIANPSLQAIEAAIYPEENDYNYFLTRPDTGETIFSKTLEEHNLNKAKYLK